MRLPVWPVRNAVHWLVMPARRRAAAPTIRLTQCMRRGSISPCKRHQY